jgi:hypothetical protein
MSVAVSVRRDPTGFRVPESLGQTGFRAPQRLGPT